MNELLPSLEELKPITDKNNTFYECGFNDEFSNLSERQKLQIVCDIIKQTIYPNPFPNPKTELETMNGNCHTACKIAMKYLKELNLCKSVKYVMVRRRKFEPEDMVSIHSILLVEGNDSVVYQFESSPYIGYKFGVVEPLSNPIYDEYTEITEEMDKFISLYKEIIYLDKNQKLDLNKTAYYINSCLESLEYKALNAYCGNALKALLKYIEDVSLKAKLEKLVLELRPYSKQNVSKKEYQKLLLNKQVDIWKEELNDLIVCGKDVKRQLELSQWIIQELKMQYPEYEIKREIDGEMIRLSFINSRFMYEKGYNTIFVKSSAFYLGCEDYIKNAFISKYDYSGEYRSNLSLPTQQTGIKPMLFSHPLGEGCIRAFNGESIILLVKSDPQKVLKLKKHLRESICGNMWNKEVIWFDNEPIIWDPFVTNLVHGTDNASEAALHYLIANPEHQNMTRFMYPNPKLLYKERK